MTSYTITISTRYEVEIDDLEKVRRKIADEYEVAMLPKFIPEEDTEFLEATITYERS